MNIALAIFQRLEQLIARSSLVGDQRIFDPAQFAWTSMLEENWQTIRTELDEVLRLRDHLPNFQDISPAQAALTTDDQWKTYFFLAYGNEVRSDCRRCPRTAGVLKNIPGLTTAFFSVLGPGKHLPEHRGPYNGVLRCQLALVVPEPAAACGILVGGETAQWREGKCLVFDDSYLHCAWNDSDRDRVVLFMDIVRPLRPPVSWLNKAVINAIGRSRLVRGSKERHLEWERRFEEHWPAPATQDGAMPNQ